MSDRSFTLGEANALVPRMERLFDALDVDLAALRTVRDRIAVLYALWGRAVERSDNADHGELAAHREEAEGIARRIEDTLQREVIALGVRLPGGGLEHGLLDFPARFQGRWVFLCWQRGEAEIGYWHELDGGYAGRRPIGNVERAELNGDDRRDATPGGDAGPIP